MDIAHERSIPASVGLNDEIGPVGVGEARRRLAVDDLAVEDAVTE